MNGGEVHFKATSKAADKSVHPTFKLKSKAAGERARLTLTIGHRQHHVYCRDFGSDRFFGLFLFNNIINCCALAGGFTLP